MPMSAKRAWPPKVMGAAPPASSRKQVGRKVATRSPDSMRTRETCIFVRSANSNGALLKVENISASLALPAAAAKARRPI